jgi:cardiolipin synthase
MHHPDTPWKLYSSNEAVWHDMLEACRHATTSIDLEQFIFVQDEIGKQFIEVCSERARAGVRVRFLFDDAGTFGRFIWDGPSNLTLTNAFLFTELSKKGIQVGAFNTIIPRSIDNHRWWFFRNHRRSLVVDSKIAFTSSQLMAEKTKSWSDASLRITGDVVKQIEQAFEIMWERAHNRKAHWGHDNPSTHDGFSYVTNAPIRKQRHTYFRLIEAIRSAHSYIYITTPYFVPDRRLLRVLKLASRRGVDVRIILPKRSNHPVVDLAGQASFSEIIKDHKNGKPGIHIYQHPGPMLHGKVAVIDGSWASIGTMNLDYVSLRYNFEANTVGTDKVFVSELHEYCLNRMKESTLIEPEKWEHRRTSRKWLEFLVSFIRQAL